MSKGSALPLLLIVIVVSAVVFTVILRSKNPILSPFNQSQATSTPDPFYPWKTYKNETYGFTIRYPKEFFVKHEPAGAANFYTIDPSTPEATPGAIIFRFTPLLEKIDVKEFQRIATLKEGDQFKEPLDVISTVTKIKNFDIANLPAIEFTIDRKFSALEGPRGEHSKIIEINKDGTILKFTANADNEVLHEKFYEIFQKIISSIKF